MLLQQTAGAIGAEPALLGSLARRQDVIAVPHPARAAVIAAVTDTTSRSPLLVAVPTTGEATQLVSDLEVYLGVDAVDLFPAWETLPFERVSPSVETMGRRMRAMWRLGDPERAPRVIVAPARALVQRLGPHVEDVSPIVVRPGSEVDPQVLVAELVAAGYRREYQVEHRGEVALRGSIVDVFASTADVPIRIDLWGDEVDRLSTFSVADQRSQGELEVAEIFPCRELLCTEEVTTRARELVASEPWGREQWERLAGGETFDGMESWLPWLIPPGSGPGGDGDHVLFDLLGPESGVILVEPTMMRARAGEIIAEEIDLAATLAQTWNVERDADLPRLHLDFDRLLTHTEASSLTLTSVPEGPEVRTVQVAGFNPVTGGGEGLIRQMGQLSQDGFCVLVAADTAASAERAAQILRNAGVDLPIEKPGDVIADLAGTGRITVGPLSSGYILPSVKLAVLCESDLTGRRRAHRTPRRVKRSAQRFFDDLTVGSHVVHEHHGVARFGGVVRRTIGGSERDYLLLEYRGDDKLYVPTDHIDSIRHYTGGETPTLNKMGGADFARTKSKIRSEVEEIAQELVVLYQKRVNSTGHAFGLDTPWQAEMEEAFPFELTPDQRSAISDVKADMELERPMDRLVCGDVGFGKTEVAIRAAFKAVQDGKQVGILVPTTLLAQQHHSTFGDRFAPYPMRVEVLSRFLTNAQARAVIQGVRDGSVDVVIGTHRLLGSDLEFKDLGLLIVDEEQRFGVSHKESIKQIKANVDVLTLTATPIPRTMEMSLTGIRDLSLLQTPPAERQPILTYVGEYDERPVAESIRRELLREGQVFYVHNRVADIEEKAMDLRDMIPEARIAVAHGQMDEGTLEKVVLDFWDGAYDVLVCTTIIESGIDMPTVNTLVVERADLLGLGQLHQLRGRVGRAGSRAYAYLFFPQNRELSEEAYERLRTIGEATELGSGFRIAMRDLEIRGAGNLLGTGQSGHIAAVGYDLYCSMVNEAISELNGEVEPEAFSVTIELPLDANLPESYISREDLRLDAYRRLAEVTTLVDVDAIEDEWTDRYGPVPPSAANLLGIAGVRAECVRTGVTDVSVTKSAGFAGPPLMARIKPLVLGQSKQMRLERLFRKSVYKPAGDEVQIPIPKGSAMIETIRNAFTELVPLDEE